MADHGSSVAGRSPAEAGTDIDYMLVQQRIESILRRILRLDRREAIGGTPLCELGLSSMGAITMQYQLGVEFGTDLQVSEILGARSVERLAKTVLSRSASEAAVAAGAGGKSGVLI
ncbi:acyl carrier protein [Bradyrhizobium sp. U87765 SZCCT0131]|uniref:phosphopantetheine-binding protein n=1 Tax=unclassified Bradyrhizobium TaxID=2631580 RepID=UPI001BA54FA2|nr:MULTISPECIES: phosphopantetheine-binding protein [unclassified Bradyrhizobium]MBR1217846.1 acyl carrier protein [Bradyrhizobium sp. U87765 SZCCT0131]MBR1261208.1 acyl carrier protein [Bradyrhizobium sp. U87765 SZCCT0134]MBR1303344.1 acyl carrier protein [Bradyrhizobium sp. U87765 SZCCT0110]MBR1318950.1 acyl carrier protein [Bradyrhizobium sp. U87765 SZCCT0109]MBR1347275.1 acyl carrier protein [Bradyrhizobium sp. U87765 SZCCT0048]